ncbi:hypothetical protein MIMGU_mgv1a0010621mg, partial [Erythranthe guttata]
MTSTSNSKGIVEDDDEEEEFQHFDDFTVASSWERFISEIEAVCRQWLADGTKNLLTIRFSLCGIIFYVIFDHFPIFVNAFIYISISRLNYTASKLDPSYMVMFQFLLCMTPNDINEAAVG